MEWPAEKMSWADFRGKLLGPTDPASAPEGSLRQMIYSKWSELGAWDGARGVLSTKEVMQFLGSGSKDAKDE